jgi:signal peptidase II
MPDANQAVTRASLAWLWLSALVLVLDQLTKAMITARFALGDRLPVFPGLDMVRLHNTGAAFSFLADQSGWQVWFFSAVALSVSAGIFWWLRQLSATLRVLPSGLSLLLGGAIGNLIDRLWHGYVVDFILVYYGNWAFPAFNVADAAITAGVALLLLDGLVLEGRRAARSVSASSDQ